MGTYATFKYLFPLSAGYSRCISIRSGGRGRGRGEDVVASPFDGTLRNVRGGAYSPWRLYRLRARFLFLFGCFPSGFPLRPILLAISAMYGLRRSSQDGEAGLDSRSITFNATASSREAKHRVYTLPAEVFPFSRTKAA